LVRNPDEIGERNPTNSERVTAASDTIRARGCYADDRYRPEADIAERATIRAFRHLGRFLANFGMLGFMWSHGCALSTQKSASGANQLGSSRLAAFTTKKSGLPRLRANNGVPQSPQNSRIAMFPLSAGSRCSVQLPRIKRMELVDMIRDAE
jgi:hypothetical protein